MKKAKLYTQNGCTWCDEAKKEIKRMKRDGTLCYDIQEVKITSKNEDKIPKGIHMTPMIEIEGRLMSWGEAKKVCPIK